MKFHTQTKLCDPVAGVKGNCMMTCFAGYFDLDISEVPAIEELFDHPTESWYLAFINWLEDKFQMTEVRHFKDGQAVDPAESGFEDYYFAAGPSPRGVHHMVIYQAGKMVHDPHPSRTGLLEVTEFITLEKIAHA